MKIKIKICLFYTLIPFVLSSTPESNQCATDMDCQLNGRCTVGGNCECYPGWSGLSCSHLNLGPTRRVWPPHNQVGLTNSWGGSIIETRSLQHLFANVNCARDSCAHTVGASIAHLTSPSLDKPFEFRGTAVPAEIENVHARVEPVEQKILLYYGDHQYPMDLPDCDVLDLPDLFSLEPNPEPYPRRVKRMGIAFADLNPNGTIEPNWKFHFPEYHPNLEKLLPVINPSPLILANGTVLLAFRYANTEIQHETLGFARATHWKGPYSLVTDWVVPKLMSEDPFLFRNRGGLHIIFHEYNGSYTAGHAFTLEASPTNWTFSPEPIYSTTVEDWHYKFDYRERPELLVDHNGDPTFLLTGVEAGQKNASFPTCASLTILTEILRAD